ncbi:sugar nucleotide-binding protein [Petrimonas sulfuriphila]|jgi:dTDP-4-dehydrorhamnose reductase|uniref:sugar nucleotide-binding protein n=1 Tax=Petrimonas sulfuriphila TaxID=285070 RepID=UPI003EB972BE
MKILLLGAGGMAGHVIYTVLNETKQYELLGTINSTKFKDENIHLDIYDIEKLNGIIDGFSPDVIINSVGVLIKGSKENPENAIYANAYFPNYLAKIAQKKKIKLIHISTDCVFSGSTGTYTESSVKDATDVYGLSKNLGEIIDDNNLTIRTSIIGPELKSNGEGLFHWFMHQKEKIYGYKSNMWSGVTTLELAKFIQWMLSSKINLTRLIHLTNNCPISKFDLLTIVNENFEKKIKILDEKDFVSNKSFISTRKDFDFPVKSYNEMIRDLKIFMLSHEDLYGNYFTIDK